MLDQLSVEEVHFLTLSLGFIPFRIKKNINSSDIFYVICEVANDGTETPLKCTDFYD